MSDITCIKNESPKGLAVFLQPISQNNKNLYETAFFGLIWVEKGKFLPEIQDIYQEASTIDYQKIVNQPETIFEQSLQKLNNALRPRLKQKNNFHLLYGLKVRDKILFSFFGKIFALFIEKKPGNEMAVTTLDDLIQNETGRIFPQFLTGNLTSNQSIFFSLNHLNTYFTPLRLATSLFSSPNALWQIKEAVAKLAPTLPFGSLHILYSSKPADPSLASMKNLIATEAKTEQILTPPILPDLKPMIKKSSQAGLEAMRRLWQKTQIIKTIPKQISATIASAISSFHRQPRPSFSLTPSVSAKRKHFTLPSINIKIILHHWRDQCSAIGQTLRHKFSQVPPWLLRQAVRLKIFWGQKADALIHYVIEKFNNLPRVSQILILFLIILLFIFGESAIYLYKTQATRESKTLVAAEITKIQQSLTEAKAGLIYNDEEKTRQAFITAQEIFKNLSQNPYLKNTTKNQLVREMRQMEIEVNHIIILKPSVLLEFKDQKMPTRVISLNGQTYLLSENSLLKLNKTDNPADSRLSVIYQNLSLNFDKIAADPDRNLIILATKNKVIEFNPKDQSSNIVNVTLNNPKDINTYNRRLYILASEPANILRLNKVGDQFTAQVWQKEKTNLINGLSLAVNGDVFVLQQSGEVWKFKNGYKKDFKLGLIEPALTAPSKILMSADGSQFYIFDPSNKRLAVFDISGKFLKQYLAETNNDLQDFAIDEKNKKIYLLTNKGITVSGY